MTCHVRRSSYVHPKGLRRSILAYAGYAKSALYWLLWQGQSVVLEPALCTLVARLLSPSLPPLSTPASLRVSAHVSRVLVYLHDLALVHRGIQTCNVALLAATLR